MAIYRKVVGTTLYLRSDEQEGYTLYPQNGGFISGSESLNRTITSVVVENAISHTGSCNLMFYWCYRLTSLDLSLFDTSNVIYMVGMFGYCEALTTLDISNFDTSNVTDMNHMLSGCGSLTSLNISNFNTSKVQDFNAMFKDCIGLIELDLSHFDTSSVVRYSFDEYDGAGYNNGMFSGCTSLEKLKIDNFIKTNSVYAYEMFYNCTALESIECKNTFDSSNSTGMFTGCTSLSGETAKGGIAYNSSKTTATYAKINGGYFTYPKRTLTTSVIGDGTITSGGTYDYGTELDVVATPNSTTYMYLDSMSKTINSVTTTITDTDTIVPYSYKFALTDNTSISATFLLRQQRTLSATSTYTIKGTGTYRYLDQPTLIAELGGGLITFNGWYEGTALFSSQNPCKFVMPDRNLSLTIQTGDNPFSNENIRQFCLQNKDGAIYNLTNRVNKWFMNDPNGLGLSKGYSQTRFGNSADVDNETYSFAQINAEILFFGGSREETYQSYYDFVRFITNAPIELWYRLPLNNSTIHHTSVEVVSFSKGEIQTDGMLHCDITMNATGFWKETESSVSASTSTIEVLNDSDFNMGFEITCAKLNGTAFTNPRITFNNGTEYGVIAIDSLSNQEFTSITINTKDGKQDITLVNGDEVITNPFAYIDFSYADGTKQFPFPKLEKGYTTINFIYDEVGQEGKSYLITYDKEFASV